MQIFEISKDFPKGERYSLTDQIRRCSRSVSANIAESYGKRRFPKHFIRKLTDADAENLETQSWLEFSFACNYIEEGKFHQLLKESQEVGRLIH